MNAENAEQAGASGLLLAPMTYQPLTDDDVFELFRTVTAHSPLPVIVYDNPGTTHFTFSTELYGRIAELPGIASIKIPGVPADPQQARARVEEIRAVVPKHVTIGLLDVTENIRERGAGPFPDRGLETTGPMGTAILTIMAAFAQLERDTMIERTRAGLAAAAANNRHGGRPRKVDAAAAARARELKGKGISASDIGKMLGVFRATVYRYPI